MSAPDVAEDAAWPGGEIYLSTLDVRVRIPEALRDRDGCLDDIVLDHFAREYPERLLGLLSSGRVAAADFPFAAQSASRLVDARIARPVLVGLLAHPDPAVRDGAIWALSSWNRGHHEDPAVCAAIRDVADADPCPPLRAQASQWLADARAARERQSLLLEAGVDNVPPARPPH